MIEGFLWRPHCGAPHGLGTLTCPTTGGALVRGSAARLRLQRGTVVAKRYKVRAWIGQDSVAFLYEAKQLDIDRRVLLKLVQADSPPDEREAEIQEMDREAHAAARVEHPNVAEVLAFERLPEGEAVLVRPWSARAKLSASLRTAGALPEEDAGDILTQILSGLHALHVAGIFHRDLGAHNVWMVDRAGCRPLARIAGLGRCSGPRIEAPRGLPPGVHYASPELLRGEDIDAASDLFACGVMLFEMLTGRRPFEAPTEQEVASAILRDDRPAAATLRPELGDGWIDVLSKALHADPARRFRNAIEFQQALPTHVRPTARLRPIATDGEAEAEIVELVDLSSPPGSKPPSSIRGSRCDTHIGRRLANKYKIESLLGSGSAGAVYKAAHVDLHRPVALKILHDWNRTSKEFVDRFKSEAFAASKLDHPNLTRVLDCGQERDGTLYLVMEYVEGKSIAALIAEQGPFPQARAVGIALQVASSLVYAHTRGIIHRDIKPENILLLREMTDDGRRTVDHAKVCDFGLAKLHTRSLEEQEMTTAGVLLGSPAYMAPEQIRGQPVDERTDIYAVGVTLFEMLTGRLPHEAQSMEELFRVKLEEPPRRPSTVVEEEFDPLLEDIILHALESDPAMRHASARDMRNELSELLEYLRSPQSSSNEVTVSVFPSELPKGPGVEY